MSLRLRLIVAFFLLSVVPLGAVTSYTYLNNARAIREGARNEAEQLAAELTQRMELVMAQLGERVGNLMALSPESGEIPTAAVARLEALPGELEARATPAPPSPPQPPATPRGPDQVAEALGDVAMLLNNIEVRGARGFGGRRGQPGGRGERAGRGGGRGDGTGRGGDGPPPPPSPPRVSGPPRGGGIRRAVRAPRLLNRARGGGVDPSVRRRAGSRPQSPTPIASGST